MPRTCRETGRTYKTDSEMGHAHDPKLVDEMLDAIQAHIDQCDDVLKPHYDRMEREMGRTHYAGGLADQAEEESLSRHFEYYRIRKSHLQDIWSELHIMSHPHV